MGQTPRKPIEFLPGTTRLRLLCGRRVLERLVAVSGPAADRQIPVALVRRQSGRLDRLFAVLPEHVVRRLRLRARDDATAASAMAVGVARRAARGGAVGLADHPVGGLEAGRQRGSDVADRGSADRLRGAALSAAVVHRPVVAGMVLPPARRPVALPLVRGFERRFAARPAFVSVCGRTHARRRWADAAVVVAVCRIHSGVQCLCMADVSRCRAVSGSERARRWNGRASEFAPVSGMVRVVDDPFGHAAGGDESDLHRRGGGSAAVDPAADVVSAVVHPLLSQSAVVSSERLGDRLGRCRAGSRACDVDGPRRNHQSADSGSDRRLWRAAALLFDGLPRGIGAAEAVARPLDIVLPDLGGGRRGGGLVRSSRRTADLRDPCGIVVGNRGLYRRVVGRVLLFRVEPASRWTTSLGLAWPDRGHVDGRRCLGRPCFSKLWPGSKWSNATFTAC
jgi:hypothetical protein